MSTKQMPVVLLRGSPVERGCQHGSQFREEIRATLADLIRNMPEDGWAHARLRAAGCLEHVSAIAPHLHGEFEGIASATELDPLDVLLLSAFEFTTGSQAGCTSAGFARADGAVISQNWDGPDGASRNLAILIHDGPDRHFMTIASAGTLGWVGMNADGLAFVNNDLLLDVSADGLPSLIVRRLMLEQRTVEGAMTVLRTHKHMSGRCFMVGDACGGMRVAEVGPSAGVTDRAVRNAVHTNHPLFAKPAMWEDIEDGARIYPSSRARLRAARGFHMAEAEDLKVLLRDRTGAPDAICKSPSLREPTGTAFSVIFDCSRREAQVASGRPDLSEYQRVGLLQTVGA